MASMKLLLPATLLLLSICTALPNHGSNINDAERLDETVFHGNRECEVRQDNGLQYTRLLDGRCSERPQSAINAAEPTHEPEGTWNDCDPVRHWCTHENARVGGHYQYGTGGEREAFLNTRKTKRHQEIRPGASENEWQPSRDQHTKHMNPRARRPPHRQSEQDDAKPSFQEWTPNQDPATRLRTQNNRFPADSSDEPSNHAKRQIGLGLLSSVTSATVSELVHSATDPLVNPPSKRQANSLSDADNSDFGKARSRADRLASRRTGLDSNDDKQEQRLESRNGVDRRGNCCEGVCMPGGPSGC